MADLVERLREASHGDHDRGCEGRMYTCTCGYDSRIFAAAEEAAAEITRLRAELERKDEALKDAGEIVDACVHQEEPTLRWANEVLGKIDRALQPGDASQIGGGAQ